MGNEKYIKVFRVRKKLSRNTTNKENELKVKKREILKKVEQINLGRLRQNSSLFYCITGNICTFNCMHIYFDDDDWDCSTYVAHVRQLPAATRPAPPQIGPQYSKSPPITTQSHYSNENP